VSAFAGHAADGTGVLADSAHGTALEVQGKLPEPERRDHLSASSGSNVKRIRLADATTKTFVVATVQGTTPGVTSAWSRWLRAPDTSRSP
jgi:hypothetical protein